MDRGAADHRRGLRHAAELALLGLGAAKCALRLNRCNAGNEDAERAGEHPFHCRVVHGGASRALALTGSYVVSSRDLAKSPARLFSGYSPARGPAAKI